MTEFRRRYSDQNAKIPRQHISRLAFLLAGLLIAVTSVSLLFVGYVASQASRQQAIANEERLFRSALADHLRTIVREQIVVASSDQSVHKLVRNFDPAYVRSSFDTLWSTYRHSKVMLISGEGDVLAESFADYTHVIRRPISETPELEVVHEKIKALYLQNRVRVPGGFGHKSLQGADPGEYAVMGFVHIDGKPAIFGAMPIIPDDYQETLPDGPPTVLLSAHYVDAFLLGQLNAQLNFANFGFDAETGTTGSGPHHIVTGPDGDPLGVFRWDSQTVGESLWPTIVPVIVILSLALGTLAFGIAWRIGQLTTSLQASEHQNRYLALHDTLTGLANRLQFNRVLESSVKNLPDKPFAVIHCDLDKFKAVNDTFGHSAGDLVIKAMAERLTTAVGKPGLVCRIGGDEFMVIYRGSVAREGLSDLCQALVAAGELPVPISNGEIAQIGLSVGIAVAPKDGSTAELLVTRSDAALYQSKKLGRGRYCFYADVQEMEVGPDGVLPLTSDVRRPRAASGPAK
ncbi:diguanylate cyclase [Roseibium sp. FZY0029]|uniref:sensor domain-containing diguanylate cyclase n=1 Tax=Roseibium sp. FZY0029 TaxID=3116647 RepID=UPI002EA7CE2C|nr:diguanylate cyclase [Roseibium sp. FZY0029]